MPAWFVICPEPGAPGVWETWYREKCVAVGWPPSEYKLVGPTDESDWAIGRKYLLQIEPGNIVIPYLKKYRLGIPGRVTRVAVSDAEWNPTVGKGVFDRNRKEPELGRRIHVEWQTDNVPPPGQFARVPKRLRTKGGETRPTIWPIKPGRLDRLMKIISNPNNWEKYGRPDGKESQDSREEKVHGKNPKWSREELILALDLYFRHPPSHISKTHTAVVELSSILNELPIHRERPDTEHFRNPNGVYMKLCNFLRLDPAYKGKGLTRGNADEESVWGEFANNRQHLAEVAAQIRAGTVSKQPVRRRYWAMCANPTTFRVHQAIMAGVRECSWIVKKADVRVGDQVVVWKAKGNEKQRGVVALAEVTSRPEVRPVSMTQFWAIEKKPAMARQVSLRFVIPRDAPLWIGQGQDSILKHLSVARATGGGVFKISEAQWDALLKVLGGWPSEESELLDRALEIREGRKGQGFTSSPLRRKTVERFAVEEARKVFQARGFSVREVGKPYDLHCTKDGREIFVEVKGTCTEGETVFLTPNEVQFAREHKGQVVLYVRSNVEIQEEYGEPKASGGSVALFEEWDVDTGELVPMAFEYRLPAERDD